MSRSSSQTVAAFLAGSLFAGGLALAGMTQPAKVVAFLDVTGDWDPSLAFVMGGAILVYMPLFRLITGRRNAPLLGGVFSLPSRRDIDAPLLVGAAMFGAGWGLAGFCPGPALTSATASSQAVTFVVAMLAGMVGVRLARALAERRHTRGPNGTATPETTS